MSSGWRRVRVPSHLVKFDLCSRQRGCFGASLSQAGHRSQREDIQGLDQKVLSLGLTSSCGCNEPTRHAAASGPGIRWILGVAVLHGYFALAAATEQIVNVKTVRLGQRNSLEADFSALFVLL